MSYTSENTFPATARVADIRELVELLGYRKVKGWTHSGEISFESYLWYDEADYRSWAGVELSIDKTKTGELSVSTRSAASRSYYDLVQQNRTIAALRRQFGGTFTTDEGGGRYMRPHSKLPAPAATGCHLAFNRFGSNLIKASQYVGALTFPNYPPHQRTIC
jgi:hypothetical protein